MSWLWLFLSGLLEIVWAVGLKYTRNFTQPLPTAITLAAMVAGFILLARAVRDIPIGTAYAVWTGIGAVGTALLGILLFGESREPLRFLFIGLIVAGIAGLRWTGSSAH